MRPFITRTRRRLPAFRGCRLREPDTSRSGDVVKVDRVADTLERLLGIEPSVVGRIAGTRQGRDGDPAAHWLAWLERLDRRQGLTRKISRPLVGKMQQGD